MNSEKGPEFGAPIGAGKPTRGPPEWVSPLSSSAVAERRILGVCLGDGDGEGDARRGRLIRHCDFAHRQFNPRCGDWAKPIRARSI